MNKLFCLVWQVLWLHALASYFDSVLCGSSPNCGQSGFIKLIKPAIVAKREGNSCQALPLDILSIGLTGAIVVSSYNIIRGPHTHTHMNATSLSVFLTTAIPWTKMPLSMYTNYLPPNLNSMGRWRLLEQTVLFSLASSLAPCPS